MGDAHGEGPMDDIKVIEEVEEETADRVSASVQYALRLVGPAEGGAERFESVRREQEDVGAIRGTAR